MKSILRTGLALAVMAFLAACSIATRSYVEPAGHKLAAGAVHPLTPPIPVRLIAHFQANGTATPGADSALQEQLRQALAASGVFVPTADPATLAVIEVTANDVSNLKDAHDRGFHTGLTFGSTGSRIDDDYAFTFNYRDAVGTDYQAVYKQAIHTTIGNDIEGPSGVAGTTPADAFRQIVDDASMNFVSDLQAQGRVPR